MHASRILIDLNSSVFALTVLIGQHPQLLPLIGWAGVTTLRPDTIDIGTLH